MFDIVVPVYNAMYHARACLPSVFSHSTRPFHLYVVNDASKPYTGRELRKLLGKYDPSLWTLIENEQNMGYLRSCNRGIEAGRNPYVICLNSDTIATPDYLERTAETFERQPMAGVLNPVSTWANWTRIPFPPGYNYLSLNEEVQRLGSNRVPEINNASGFYFAVRRELFDTLGLFDEVYGMGYWEEADFCMKALEAGYRVVVDDNLYIYHHGWGSFQETGRNENMDRNGRIFMSRWESKFTPIKEDWKKNDPIAPLSKKLKEDNLWKKNGLLAGRAISKRDAQRMIDSLKAPELDLAGLTRELRLDQTWQPGPDRRRIVYILPAVLLYGGIISVLQVVNQLILRGFDVNVATYGKVDESVYGLFPTYFRAYQFPDMASLVAEFPACDAVVATQWETVYAAVALKQRDPNLEMVYFVQDYEPDFYIPEHPNLAFLAERTYWLVYHKIVKTQWLRRKLLDFPGEIHRIPLGLNLDFFHDQGLDRPQRIVSLARPSSLRRNFKMVQQVFSALHAARPALELALYGEGYDPDTLPFPVHSFGKLTEMQQVADALNTCTLLVDCSTFQGFGRPGLEAMACGTAAVLTHEGGITQYAKHEYNCLLIDPMDCNDIVRKILDLLDNPGRRARLIANGKKTADDYSLDNEGGRTAALFERLGAQPTWSSSHAG